MAGAAAVAVHAPLPVWALAFAGSVTADETFVAPLGEGLVFRLAVYNFGGGWTISVAPEAEPQVTPDFVYVASPPYRGDHPRYVAPVYGHSAADAVAWSPRVVRFVRTRADYEVALAAVRALLWPDTDYPKETARAVLGTIEGRTGTLELTIEGHQIDRAADGREVIARLRFRVEVRAAP